MPDGIIVASNGTVVARRVLWARSFGERARGLIGRPRLRDGDAFVLERAPQVHTFAMRYAIGVVFCDRSWVVEHVVPTMRPNRITAWVSRARYAIELPVEAAARIRVGDRLVVARQASLSDVYVRSK